MTTSRAALSAEDSLDAKRIDECFESNFFESNSSPPATTGTTPSFDRSSGGSMSADSSRGSMTGAPAFKAEPTGGSWALWKRLAEKDAAFGRPWVFCLHIDQTKWVTFTVTDSDARFFKRMERSSGSPAGHRGLVTLKSSSWLVTFHLDHSPAYAAQPEGTSVWWGYGLFPDRVGDCVMKRTSDCTGREILVEVSSHLGFQDDTPALLATANCIPCMLPYTTSQFMPRDWPLRRCWASARRSLRPMMGWSTPTTLSAR